MIDRFVHIWGKTHTVQAQTFKNVIHNFMWIVIIYWSHKYESKQLCYECKFRNFANLKQFFEFRCMHVCYRRTNEVTNQYKLVIDPDTFRSYEFVIHRIIIDRVEYCCTPFKSVDAQAYNA